MIEPELFVAIEYQDSLGTCPHRLTLRLIERSYPGAAVLRIGNEDAGDDKEIGWLTVESAQELHDALSALLRVRDAAK